MICDFYWPYLGGVEQHVRTLARSLADRGHVVTVATLSVPNAPGVENDHGIEVLRLKSTMQRFPALFSNPERPWAPPFPDPAITVELARIISARRPDVVHGHDWLARSFLPLRWWSRRRFGTRFVSSLHYYTLSCAKKNLMRTTSTAGSLVEAPCSGPAPVKCIRCARHHYGVAVGVTTAVSNWLGAAAEQAGASTFIVVSRATATGNRMTSSARNVWVVPNFVPDPPTSPDPTIEDLVAQLPDGEFVLFVGDLRPMKGLDVLLEAYRRMRSPMPLVLIGKPWPDTPALIPSGVEVHHRWPNTAVAAAWQRSTIAVAPSLWSEPFGMVVIEAMAAGTPVIGARVGGIPEIIEDGVSGVLVPPGDPDALRTALEALIADEPRRMRMGDAAVRRAALFSAANVVPQIESIYRGAQRPERPRGRESSAAWTQKVRSPSTR